MPSKEGNSNPTQKSKTLLSLALGLLVVVIAGLGVIYSNTSRIVVSNKLVTNQTSNSASIVWTTDKLAKASVKVSKSPDFADAQIFYDDRDIEEVAPGQYELTQPRKREVHHVTVRKLDPQVEYYFKVVNNNKSDNSTEDKFQTTQVLEELQTPDPVYGKIVTADGAEAKEGVVVLQKKATEGESQLISTFLEEGSYSLDTANLLSVNLDKAYSSAEYIQEMNILGVEQTVIPTKISVDKDQDQPVEDIILGVDKDIVEEGVEVQSESCTCEFNADGSDKYCGTVGSQYCEGSRTLQKYCNATKVNGTPTANHIYPEEVPGNPLKCGSDEIGGNAPGVLPCTAAQGNPEQCQSPEENNNCVSIGQINVKDNKGTYTSQNCIDDEIVVNRTRHTNGVCNYTFVKCVKGTNPNNGSDQTPPAGGGNNSGSGSNTQVNIACNYGDTARGKNADSGKYDGSCWIPGLNKDICRYGDKCGTTTIGTCKCGSTYINSGETCNDTTQICSAGSTSPSPIYTLQPTMQPTTTTAQPVAPVGPDLTPGVCEFDDSKRGSNIPADGKTTFDGSCWITSLGKDDCRKGDKCGTTTQGTCKCGSTYINSGDTCESDEVSCSTSSANPDKSAEAKAGTPVQEQKVVNNVINNTVNATQIIINLFPNLKIYMHPADSTPAATTTKEVPAEVVSVYGPKVEVKVDGTCGWIVRDDVDALSSKDIKPSAGSPEVCPVEELVNKGVVKPTVGKVPQDSSATKAGVPASAQVAPIGLITGATPSSAAIYGNLSQDIISKLVSLGISDSAGNAVGGKDIWGDTIESNYAKVGSNKRFYCTGDLVSLTSGDCSTGVISTFHLCNKDNFVYLVPNNPTFGDHAKHCNDSVVKTYVCAQSDLKTVTTNTSASTAEYMATCNKTSGTTGSSTGQAAKTEQWSPVTLRDEAVTAGIVFQRSSLNDDKYKVVNGSSYGILQLNGTIYIDRLATGILLQVLGRIDSSVNVYHGNSVYVLFKDLTNNREVWMQNPFLDSEYKKLSVAGAGMQINFVPRGGTDELLKTPWINYYNIPAGGTALSIPSTNTSGTKTTGRVMVTVSSHEAQKAGIEVSKEVDKGVDINKGSLIGKEDVYKIDILSPSGGLEMVEGVTSDLQPGKFTKYSFVSGGSFQVVCTGKATMDAKDIVGEYQFILGVFNGKLGLVRNIFNQELFSNYISKGKDCSSASNKFLSSLINAEDGYNQFPRYYAFDKNVSKSDLVAKTTTAAATTNYTAGSEEAKNHGLFVKLVDDGGEPGYRITGSGAISAIEPKDGKFIQAGLKTDNNFFRVNMVYIQGTQKYLSISKDWTSTSTKLIIKNVLNDEELKKYELQLDITELSKLGMGWDASLLTFDAPPKTVTIYSEEEETPSLAEIEVRLYAEDPGLMQPGKYTTSSTNATTKEFTLTAPGKIVYFQDLNADGIKQDNEPLYDGDVASLNIQFNKVSEVQTYEINTGWNLISFPIMMRGDGTSNIVRASDLIKNLNNSNIQATHVTVYRSGKFIPYSLRKDNNGNEFKYGEDFNILPGEGYFIKSYSKGNLIVEGNKIQNSQEIAVDNGWNLVGIYNSNQLSYKAFDILGQLNTAGVQTESLSKWGGGMYYTVILKDNQQYGNDFSVYQSQGYFIKVINRGTGKFAPK